MYVGLITGLTFLLGDTYTVTNGVIIKLTVKFLRLSAANLYVRNELLRLAKLWG
jgi:hypothetical protein